MTDSAPVAGVRNERYYACAMCGPAAVYYEIRFDAGTVSPTVGETITGGISGATGVVASAILESGSYSAGTAVGTLELSGVTGDTDGLAFSDNEALTGNSTFSGVANGQGIRKDYGLMYPEGNSVERDGKRYCQFHYRLRFVKKDIDEDVIDIEEEEEEQ